MTSLDFHPTVLLRSEESDDEVGVIENTVPPGWAGPPLHHHDFDEAFYVLTGEPTFQLGPELRTAGPGAFAFAPRGVDHTLANLGDAEARYLIVCTPGGFERYFDRIAAEQAGVEPPATASKPYPETSVVGPPIGADRERGARIPPPEGHINVLLRSEQSGGHVSIMDNSIGAGSRTRSPTPAPPARGR